MPFLNSATTVGAALKSIFRQSFTDYEVIAIDDGSSDDGYDRVAALRDPRVRLYRNDRNLGVAASRNRALDLMQGEFMAPMDADDTCDSRRLEWTVRVMRDNPQLGACGGWMRVYGATFFPFVMRQPCKAASVKSMYLYGNPFVNGTLLVRRRCIEQYRIRYNEAYRTGEDYDFCARLLEHVEGVNIPSVLLNYTWNPRGLTARVGEVIRVQRMRTFRPHLEALMERPLTDSELGFHVQIGNGAGAESESDLRSRLRWLEELLIANENRRHFDPNGLSEATAMIGFRICRNSAQVGRIAWELWRQSVMSRSYAPHPDEVLGFLASVVKSGLARHRAHGQGALPQ